MRIRQILDWFCRIIGLHRHPEYTDVKQPNNWNGAAETVAGTKHIRAQPPIPCQDAALVKTEERPIAFVADGAGSASMSHFGAQETVLRLSHIVAALEDINVCMLDVADSPTETECHTYARRLIIHTSETLKALADEKSMPFKEFRCTLLGIIVGAERIFWIKIGDGHIVKEQDGNLQTVGPSGKGQYANVTSFVAEKVDATQFACGVFPAAAISGIALMTDGAAEKLVSNDGKKVAGRIGKFFAGIRTKSIAQKDVHDFLSDENIWKPPGYTGDDKGLALLARIND